MKSVHYARQLVVVIAVALALAWTIGLSHVVIAFALEAGTPHTAVEDAHLSSDGIDGHAAATTVEAETPSYAITAVESREHEIPGERQIHALAEAYPDRIAEIQVREGQWAARINDTWYYYAAGRMLPRELLEEYDQYTRVRLYQYRTGPAQLPKIDDERAEHLRKRVRQREADPPVRHNGFLDALYGIGSAHEAEHMMVRVRFLGLSTRVHPKVVNPLARVEAEIVDAMKHDSEVRRFVESLGSAGGYSWREIAGTASRSYHSYGIAIDLVPRSYHGSFGYWRWAMQAGIEDWWDVPFERRFYVPQPVVDAFERQEFIWGGKWLFFDPIHFEYRPELFVLSGYRDEQ